MALDGAANSQQGYALDVDAVLVGVRIGLVGGAILALLFAPISGQRMRRKIQQQWDGALESASERVQSLRRRDPVSDSLEAGKAAAQQRLTSGAS